MRETEMVEHIRRWAAKGPQHSQLVRGIGDDCAVVRANAKEDWVFTTDFSLEGRHFTLNRYSAAEIGGLALARSLSDLAAMGAEPMFCLVSLALPGNQTEPFLSNFYRGLLKMAKKYSISLAGGDLSRFDKITVDVMCCGSVPRGKALLRSGAKVGEKIYVTGKLGAAAQALKTGGRLILPVPRVKAGILLREIGASAAIDISDGLSLDLARLCKASGVSAELRSSALPIARKATLEEALYGGEDYELLFTAPAKITMPSGMIEIGAIKWGKECAVVLDGERLQFKGFDHFA